LFAFVHLFVLKNLFFFTKHRLILRHKCQIDQIDGLFNGRSEAVLGNRPARVDSPCSVIDVKMHNSEYKKSVQIGYVSGGFLNCAPKLLGDLAPDGSVPATSNAMSRERAATTRHYLPEELTCGVAA
jgi:hypothetical protein